MSQEEVVKILQDLDVATAEEIAEQIDKGIVAVRKNLRALLKEMEVERIELTKEDVAAKGVKFSCKHYAWRLREDE